MTPQKITVKIPRKQGELIPFDLDKWNTGEYEAIDKKLRIGRVLCTDNGGSYPIIVAYGYSQSGSYTINGRYTTTDTEASLFLRKKSSEELPKDLFVNIYPDFIGAKQISLEKANENCTDERVGIVHITCQWEDAV